MADGNVCEANKTTDILREAVMDSPIGWRTRLDENVPPISFGLLHDAAGLSVIRLTHMPPHREALNGDARLVPVTDSDMEIGPANGLGPVAGPLRLQNGAEHSFEFQRHSAMTFAGF
jgi:hypothetical protein